MIRSLDGVNISVSKASFKKLFEFYRDTVGLKVDFEGEMGKGEDVAGLKIGKDNLYLITHSKIKGKNKEPQRFWINIEVDDIKKEVARLKKAKVKLVAPIYHVEEYGWVATFADPDANYFQIVQVRAN